MHDDAGDVVNGSYQLEDLIDGKPMFKKDGKVNGLDVLIYYARRWCFGPQVGGVVVWATNDELSLKKPPKSGCVGCRGSRVRGRYVGFTIPDAYSYTKSLDSGYKAHHSGFYFRNPG